MTATLETPTIESVPVTPATAAKRTIKILRTESQLRDITSYPVPSEAELNGEYTRDERLEKIVQELANEYGHKTAQNCTIVVCWKDKGGKTKGQPTLGKCIVPTGRERYLLREAHDADVLIWVAADHCRALGLTHHQMRALLWHELLHLSETEEPEDADDAWEADLTTVPHDVEAFYSELEHFGAWRESLGGLVNAVRQMTLEETV